MRGLRSAASRAPGSRRPRAPARLPSVCPRPVAAPSASRGRRPVRTTSFTPAMRAVAFRARALAAARRSTVEAATSEKAATEIRIAALGYASAAAASSAPRVTRAAWGQRPERAPPQGRGSRRRPALPHGWCAWRRAPAVSARQMTASVGLARATSTAVRPACLDAHPRESARLARGTPTAVTCRASARAGIPAPTVAACSAWTRATAPTASFALEMRPATPRVSACRGPRHVTDRTATPTAPRRAPRWGAALPTGREPAAAEGMSAMAPGSARPAWPLLAAGAEVHSPWELAPRGRARAAASR